LQFGLDSGDKPLKNSGEPDPPRLNQADKDSNREVEILGGDVTEWSRQVDAAAAEVAVKGALVLHDFAGQRPMEDRYQHTQQ
jgi:hypothetical protein